MPSRSTVTAYEQVSVVIQWRIIVALSAHACNPGFGVGVGWMNRRTEPAGAFT